MKTLNKKTAVVSIKKKKGVKLFLLALPSLALVFILHYMPLWGLVLAFTDYKPSKGFDRMDWVGLKNFTMLFGNAVMRKNVLQSLWNTLGIQFWDYLLYPLPMFFAIFLNELRSNKFKKLIQTVSTLPHFLSWVIMYAIANALFSGGGLINSLLSDWGSTAKINILATDKNVWLTQVLFAKWMGLGWGSIVFFSALAGIDQEMYDAAMVDGAGRMQRIRYITIPHLMPTFLVLFIMGIGKLLNTGVDQYFVFSNAMNAKYITTLDLYVYKLGIGNGMIPQGIAVGMMKSIVALLLFTIANTISKKIRGYGIA